MNIVIHTVSDLVVLYIVSFISGILLSLIYLSGTNVYRISVALKCPRFVKYSVFRNRFSSEKNSKAYTIINDVSICLLASVVILSLTFVFNSGNFRIFSVIAAFPGFFLGWRLFEGISCALFSALLYAVKIIIETVTWPLVWLVGKFIKIIRKLIAILVSRYRNKVIRKYTEDCFKNASEYASYGFTDDYYKEYLK